MMLIRMCKIYLEEHDFASRNFVESLDTRHQARIIVGHPRGFDNVENIQGSDARSVQVDRIKEQVHVFLGHFGSLDLVTHQLNFDKISLS